MQQKEQKKDMLARSKPHSFFFFSFAAPEPNGTVHMWGFNDFVCFSLFSLVIMPALMIHAPWHESHI